MVRTIFRKVFLNSIIADNTSITIKDDVMYLGKVIADRENLFSQRIVDEDGASVVDNATDSYGNTHVGALRIETRDDIVYSLNEKYVLLKLKIAVDGSSESKNQCTVTVLADGQEVWTRIILLPPCFFIGKKRLAVQRLVSGYFWLSWFMW